METSDIIVFILILLVVICIIVRGMIYNYANNKTRLITEKGYYFVCDFLSMSESLDYYRNKEHWISSKFENILLVLLSEKEKWYVRLSGADEISNLISFYHFADRLTKAYSPFFSLDHYFAFSEFQELDHDKRYNTGIIVKVVNDRLKEWVQSEYDKANIELKNASNPDNINKKNQFEKYKKGIYNNPSYAFKNLRKIHNREFIKKELSDNKDYFDNVLKYPLDDQQRESIVILEDNCLVISSAGSGKTSTSIAKVKYLLEKRHIPKEEILVLSYNRKTADEFEERLGVEGLTCKTFHALAMSIIGKTAAKRPDVCSPDFLLQCFYSLVKNNDDYKDSITKYLGEIASLTMCNHDYEEAEDFYEDRETYGIMAPYGDMNGNPVYTKSEEEKKICTWLTTHGVKYLYEQPYPYNTADLQYRQYKPDFTIYYTENGQSKYVFLEHFGIDKYGDVPKWFGDGKKGGWNAANSEYKSGIRWKRKLHKDNNTVLLETTSAMFHDGTIYKHLLKQLNEVGVPIKELSSEEKFALLFERDKAMEDNVMNLFTSFINLMKSSSKTFDSIMETIKNDGKDEDFCERCHFLMYEVIKPLYDEYQSSLAARGQMDFTDLILHAAELCSSHKYASPYSYILVDEFQDISVDRYLFLKSLRRKSPMTKMYCVGDDWQSIYRFSGSDMNLFNKFENYFGFTEKCKIETTYRFGNPLIARSSEFILKNPNQVEKKVKPVRYMSLTIKGEIEYSPTTYLSFVPFERGERNSGYLEKIREVLDEIPDECSIMLLGRYNYEVNVFPRNCIESSPNSKKAIVRYAGKTMNFMSVHSSKGLEAEYVIILNCSQDGGGFPSRVSDDPILGYVLSEIDTFEYSEERRLFYVAITRASCHTIVMYNQNMPSVFVTEMTEKDDNSLHCPVCKKGRLKILRDAVASNGMPYRNYACSNSIAGCKFFWRVFFEDEEDLKKQYNEFKNRL